MRFAKPGFRREDLLFSIIIVLVSAGGVNTLQKPAAPYFAVAGVAAGLVMPVRYIIRRIRGSLKYPQPIAATEYEVPTPARRPHECIVVGPDRSQPRLDTALAVSPPDEFVQRVRFATTDDLIKDITRLNVYGYAKSRYGGARGQKFFQAKLERNRAIAGRNPFAFAAVVDAKNPELYLGFTSILPLTAEGSRRYLNAPGVPDNEVTGEMVAREGAPFHDALAFAIAQMKMFREYALQDLERNTQISREPDLVAVSDLVRLLTYQLGVLVATGDVRNEFQLVGQSTVDSVQKLFARMGMSPASYITTADGEPAFQALMQVVQVGAARSVLRNRGILASDTPPDQLRTRSTDQLRLL